METHVYTDNQGNQVTETIDKDGNVLSTTVVASGSAVGIIGANVSNCTVTMHR